jgi:hypothetical protein
MEYKRERGEFGEVQSSQRLGYAWTFRVQFLADAMMGIFIFATASRPVPGPIQPPITCILEALTPGTKRLGREVNHSPLSSAEVKNAWSYTAPLPIHLHGVVLN